MALEVSRSSNDTSGHSLLVLFLHLVVHKCTRIVLLYLCCVLLESNKGFLGIVWSDLKVYETVDHLWVGTICNIDGEIWVRISRLIRKSSLLWCRSLTMVFSAISTSIPSSCWRPRVGLPSFWYWARSSIFLPDWNDVVKYYPTMVSSSENLINVPWAQTHNVLEYWLNLILLPESKLPILSITAGEEVTLLCESQGMVPTSCYLCNRLVMKILYELWSRIILIGPQA